MIPFLKDLFLNETKRSILFLVISGISLLISFLEPKTRPLTLPGSPLYSAEFPSS